MNAIIASIMIAEARLDQFLDAAVSERVVAYGNSHATTPKDRLTSHELYTIAYTHTVMEPNSAMKAQYNQLRVRCGQLSESP